MSTDTVVTMFYTVKNKVPLSRDQTITNFSIKAFDSLSKQIWQTSRSKVIGNENGRYLVKFEIPERVVRNTESFKPAADITEVKTITVEGVQTASVSTTKSELPSELVSTIRLNINSNPMGAVTYLVPNRIWSRNFNGKPWQAHPEWLEDYRIGNANTTALIDETTYAVVYQNGNKYVMVKHFTKPMRVAKEQTVSVLLNQ